MGVPLVTIRLAGTPRGKGRPKFSTIGGHVRARTDEPTRNYEAALRIAAEHEMRGQAPIVGPLDVLMIATFPVTPSWAQKRQREALAGASRPTSKPDADNIAKMCDALNGVVWVDDAQIVDVTVRKWYGAAPSLVIEVRPAEVKTVAVVPPPRKRKAAEALELVL